MFAPERIFETLGQLQSWLTKQQAALSPSEWERMSADLEATIESVRLLIARGDLRGAEAVLDQLAARYLERIERGTRSAPDPREPRSVDPHRDGDRGDGYPRGWDVDDRGWGSPDSRDPDAFDPVRGETVRGVEPTRSTDHPATVMEQLQRISRLLSGGRAPASIETHPEVLLPTEVLENTTFQVTVAAHPKATAYSLEKLSLPAGKQGSVDLEVEVVLPADQALRASGPTEAVLRVHGDGRAAAVAFELFAAKPGAHPVAVAFRYGGIERARREGRILVRTREEYAQTPNSDARASLSGAAVASGGSRHHGLLLQVDLRGVSTDFRSFRVVLGGSEWKGVPIEGRIELPPDAPQLLAELCREMSTVSKLETAQARELRLRAIGRSLAQRTLPSPIREALADPQWAPGTSLHIESGDLHVPWEMLLIGDGVSGEFLGERFAVTRYPRLGSPREVVGGSAGFLIAPRSSGLQVGTERAALQALLGQTQELGHLQQVQQLLLGAGPCGVLHLACHGNCSPTGNFRDVLVMDGGALSVVDVVAPERGQRSAIDGALVFINACRANIAEPGLWGHDGWAGAFLRAGAGAFIAPAWTVSDRGAALFAEGLYRGSASGQSLGEAARQARLSALTAGSADRLGYAVFASPTARLTGTEKPPQPPQPPGPPLR